MKDICSYCNTTNIFEMQSKHFITKLVITKNSILSRIIDSSFKGRAILIQTFVKIFSRAPILSELDITCYNLPFYKRQSYVDALQQL